MALKPCNRCGKDIGFRKEPDGKTIPINPDGTPHRCQAQAAATNGHAIIGRITEYEGSNVHIGTRILFILPENRKSAQETYPVGTVVKAANEKGTCKGIEKATGLDLEKFLKEEELQRNQQPTSAPAPAAPQQDRTSPMSAPVEQHREPISRDLLLSMVNNPDTYWKAKTLMDIEQHESICQQVEWKNWSTCIELAKQFHAIECPLEDVFTTSEKIHEFIQGKVKAGRVQ